MDGYGTISFWPTAVSDRSLCFHCLPAPGTQTLMGDLIRCLGLMRARRGIGVMAAEVCRGQGDRKKSPLTAGQPVTESICKLVCRRGVNMDTAAFRHCTGAQRQLHGMEVSMPASDCVPAKLHTSPLKSDAVRLVSLTGGDLCS